MSTKSLIIPFRIEALYLSENISVCPPTADFSQLPYADENGNPSNGNNKPFIGDSITPNSFDQNFVLPAGVHLHFILPQFLGRPIPKNSGLKDAESLPAAPNRWLIIKTKNGTTSYALVQSDFIFDQDKNPGFATCISYQMPQPGGTQVWRPYCYMGKIISDNEIVPADADRVAPSFNNINNKPLTILGVGDYNFSAFYPNCNSVFGYYDANESTFSTAVDYEVYGWHDQAANDVLSSYIAKAITDNVSNLCDQLKTLFSIEVNSAKDDDLKQIVNQSIYYSKKTIDQAIPNIVPDYSTLKIAVGSSGTEALASMISNEVEQNNQMEEQIESINLYSKLNSLLGDVGPKFHEARHTQGFRSISGGHQWAINALNNSDNPAPSEPNLNQDQLLPPNLITDLDALNKAQSAYDKGCFELESMQEQMYLDWCQYMHAKYPKSGDDGSEAYSDFIKNYSNSELGSKISSVGTAGIDVSANTITCSDTNSSLAKDLLNAWAVVSNQLKNSKEWNLLVIAADSFWQPKPPAVVFSGFHDDGTEEDLIKKPGNNLFKIYLSDFDSSNINSIIGNLKNIQSDSVFNSNIQLINKKNAGLVNYSTQNSTPFFLDWEVDIYPLYESDNQTGNPLDPKIIVKNFGIKPQGADLDITQANYATTSYPISGHSLLSHSSRKAVLHNIMQFLKIACTKIQRNKKDLCDTIQTNISSNSSDLFQGISDTDKPEALAVIIFHYYENATGFNDFKTNIAALYAIASAKNLLSKTPLISIYYAALDSLNYLVNHNILAQMLSGFNHGCIMRKMTAQLPIIDPMNDSFISGADVDGTTAEKANLYIGSVDKNSVWNDNTFLPIRSGKWELNLLNLIDNFGKIYPVLDKDKNVNPTVYSAETMVDQTANSILPPRITQASRLNFNWLSADHNPAIGATENIFANSHDGSSPICGWIVPNYFNNDLMVFGADGSALGYLDIDGKWNIPPSYAYACNIDANIDNEHLKRVIKWLSNDNNLLDNFLSSMQEALNNASPAHTAVFKAKSLWMGRPIAIVRASINFELKGLPALNQSRFVFDADYKKYFSIDNPPSTVYTQRSSNGWDEILMHIRLGEHRQLDDGLLGYWQENNLAATDNLVLTNLVAPESDSAGYKVSGKNQIITFSDNNKPSEELAINGFQLFTFLMDPRSGVHITSGVLPTVKKSIDSSHYLPALKKIQIWFRVFPLLQPDASLTENAVVDLPKLDDYEWKWYDRFGGTRSIMKEDHSQFTVTENTISESFLILNPKV